MTLPLASCRILVVEDEFIVAAMIVDILEDEGAVITGPLSTVVEALELVEAGAFDAALLDWNLGGESSAPIARALRGRGVPFLIATGYGEVEEEFAGVPVLSKPYVPGKLIEELTRLTGN